MREYEIRPDFDVEQFLEPQIYHVVSQPERVESYLLHRGDTGVVLCQKRFVYRILSTGPLLDTEQVNSLTQLVLNRGSYYFGRIRSLCPDPGFALRLWREDASVDLLIDLYRAGWDFLGEKTPKMSWCHPVIGRIRQLAKSLFPEQASASPYSMWKLGAIKRLVESVRRAKIENTRSG
jgi:hypothetical protein